MRIWFQLLSSEEKMSRFIGTVQQLVDRAADPGTRIEVRGTTQGVIGDQYRLFYQYDQREVLDNGLNIRRNGGYDAFAIANSLDPGIVELREMLDIPVVSFTETNALLACTMGERFGIVVANRKIVPRFRELVHGYGLRDRLASVEPVHFDDVRAQEGMFHDEAIAATAEKHIVEAVRRAADKGAEVVFAAGPLGAVMAQRGIFSVDNVALLDPYTVLAKTAEMRVRLHKLSGVCVSRHCLYEAPSRELVRKVGEAFGVDALRE